MRPVLPATAIFNLAIVAFNQKPILSNILPKTPGGFRFFFAAVGFCTVGPLRLRRRDRGGIDSRLGRGRARHRSAGRARYSRAPLRAWPQAASAVAAFSAGFTGSDFNAAGLPATGAGFSVKGATARGGFATGASAGLTASGFGAAGFATVAEGAGTGRGIGRSEIRVESTGNDIAVDSNQFVFVEYHGNATALDFLALLLVKEYT